jgi:sugar O-acyltransferase (sialic acid O-acetyltransferase NeuD family)
METTVDNESAVYIVGAGGAGREALDISQTLGLTIAGFLDDGRAGDQIRGLDVSAPESAPADAAYVVGIASAQARRRLSALLDARGLRPHTIVHPRATIGPEVSLGLGCIVHANVLISSDVTIADHCQIHYNATVGHDSVLEPFVTVYPGANVAGNVRLGTGAMVGSGAAVLQGLVVGADATIGAGAVVTRDVQPGAVMTGVPARPLPLPATRRTQPQPS